MGLFLASTSDKLQLVTTSTQVVHVSTDWIDVNGTSPASATFTPGRQDNPAINSATTTDIVPAPGASVTRNIKNVCILNTDASVATTVTVQRPDGTNTPKVKTLSLPAGYSYNYADGRGWYVADANGTEVVDNTFVSGLFIKSTVILNGTTSLVLSSRTNSIRARLQAGGGAGGGCPAVTSQNGSGASSGGYAEWTVAVTPGATLTCAVGAGGTGVSGAAGNNGGNTTLTVGGTTCTANGGIGGNVGIATNSVAGASSPAVSTNGTLNMGGVPGERSAFGATVTASGGNGGSSIMGGAGGVGKICPTQGVGGAAGPGFGGGGGGGMTTGTAQLGGAGSNGVLIVDEYT